MKPVFSLVVATLNRFQELDDFLHSVSQQTISRELTEVIVVDQNDEIDLGSILEKYRSCLNLKHIKSSKKGLSYNRNLGISKATGQILAFPDDDCRYYPNTLEKVLKVFENNRDVSLILGRIVDRDNAKNIIRNWPKERKIISKFNFFLHYSSITLFTTTHQLFDERLGVGTFFGSYEDADFVFNIIDQTGYAIYEPTVEVWHPQQSLYGFSEKKIIQYGLGFGALARKHWSLVFLYLFSGVLIYHSYNLLKAIMRGNKSEVRKRWFSITSRVRGFIQFPRVKDQS